MANDWHDLGKYRICVVDVLGKFNFHRYIALLCGFGIPHGIMLDGDKNKNHQEAINELVKECATSASHALATPHIFEDCLETFLGLSVPSRDDRKPLEILKAISNGTIGPEKLRELRSVLETCLAMKSL